MTLYAALWYFLIYAVLGWCVEVAYAAVNVGKFINRGFLNGPYCPIYGTGAVVVILLLTPIAGQFMLLFLGSVLLTTAIEFLAGFVLEKLFHEKWWDYTNQPFNIKGYICPKFSLLWGMACVIVVDGVHPWIERFVNWMHPTAGLVLVIILSAIMLADFIVTLTDLLRIRARMTALRTITGELHKLSDSMGEHISDGVLDAMEVGTAVQERAAEGSLRVQEAIEEGRQKLEEGLEEGRRRLDAEAQEMRDYMSAEYRAAQERAEELYAKRKRELERMPVRALRRMKNAYPALYEQLHQMWEK